MKLIFTANIIQLCIWGIGPRAYFLEALFLFLNNCIYGAQQCDVSIHVYIVEQSMLINLHLKYWSLLSSENILKSSLSYFEIYMSFNSIYQVVQ